MAFVLGIVVSIAANVAHTWHPSAAVLQAAAAHGTGPGSWRPEIGAQLSAAFYPLALLLTVEILTRVDWQPGWRFALARFGGTGAVALVAAIVSYRHMAALLAAYGEDALTAAIGPFAVDGLMVVASFALLSITHTDQSPHAQPDASSPAVHDASRPTTAVDDASPVDTRQLDSGNDTTLVTPETVSGPVTLDTAAETGPGPDTGPSKAQLTNSVSDHGDADLLEQARQVDLDHRENNNGRPVSADNLGRALKISKTRATRLVKTVRAETIARTEPGPEAAESQDRLVSAVAGSGR